MIDAKIGDKITIAETVHGFDDTSNCKDRTYTITAIYPYYGISRVQRNKAVLFVWRFG